MVRAAIALAAVVGMFAAASSVAAEVVRKCAVMVTIDNVGLCRELRSFAVNARSSEVVVETNTQLYRRLYSLAIANAHEAYVRENRLDATEDDLSRVRAFVPEFAKAPPSSSAEDIADFEKFQRTLIQSWKAGRHLHQKYGGTVRLTMFGPEASDAQFALLRDRASHKRLTFLDETIEREFWNEAKRDLRLGQLIDEARGRAAFACADWEPCSKQKPQTR